LSTWVQALLSKFVCGQPGARLLQDWNDQGLHISQGTLTDGLRRLLPMFAPPVEAGPAQLRRDLHWHADETRWEVYEELDRKVGHRSGTLLLFSGCERLLKAGHRAGAVAAGRLQIRRGAGRRFRSRRGTGRAERDDLRLQPGRALGALRIRSGESLAVAAGGGRQDAGRLGRWPLRRLSLILRRQQVPRRRPGLRLRVGTVGVGHERRVNVIGPMRRRRSWPSPRPCLCDRPMKQRKTRCACLASICAHPSAWPRRIVTAGFCPFSLNVAAA
jgi:hypothetical protein